MNKPEIIKAYNDYPCSDCGGHGVPRVKNGAHYIQCHKCPAKTGYCLEGEAEARYRWATMNAAKEALKSGVDQAKDEDKIFTLSIHPNGAIEITNEEIVDPQPIKMQVTGSWPAFGSEEFSKLMNRPVECIECLKPLDESLPEKYCDGCGEPIHYNCSCSNCN